MEEILLDFLVNRQNLTYRQRVELSKLLEKLPGLSDLAADSEMGLKDALYIIEKSDIGAGTKDRTKNSMELMRKLFTHEIERLKSSKA